MPKIEHVYLLNLLNATEDIEKRSALELAGDLAKRRIKILDRYQKAEENAFIFSIELFDCNIFKRRVEEKEVLEWDLLELDQYKIGSLEDYFSYVLTETFRSLLQYVGAVLCVYQKNQAGLRYAKQVKSPLNEHYQRFKKLFLQIHEQYPESKLQAFWQEFSRCQPPFNFANLQWFKLTLVETCAELLLLLQKGLVRGAPEVMQSFVLTHASLIRTADELGEVLESLPKESRLAIALKKASVISDFDSFLGILKLLPTAESVAPFVKSALSLVTLQGDFSELITRLRGRQNSEEDALIAFLVSHWDPKQGGFKLSAFSRAKAVCVGIFAHRVKLLGSASEVEMQHLLRSPSLGRSPTSD